MLAQLADQFQQEAGHAGSPTLNGWVTWHNADALNGTFHPFANTANVHPIHVAVGGGTHVRSWHATLGEHSDGWKMQFGDTIVKQTPHFGDADPLPTVAAIAANVFPGTPQFGISGVPALHHAIFVSASDWEHVEPTQRDALHRAGWQFLVWHPSVSEIAQ